jgi:hypothetical protein
LKNAAQELLFAWAGGSETSTVQTKKGFWLLLGRVDEGQRAKCENAERA